MSVNVSCAECGVVFCLGEQFQEHRRKDHRSFYCPNGHGNVYEGKTDEQRKIERLEASLDNDRRCIRELNAEREELIGALRECPVPGCRYRSRRVIPRDPVAMGRGIERVRADLFEHMVRDHTTRVPAAPQLEAGAP